MTDELPEQRFSYRVLKGERVMIYSHGAHVTTLAGRAAGDFLARVERNPDGAALLDHLAGGVEACHALIARSQEPVPRAANSRFLLLLHGGRKPM